VLPKIEGRDFYEYVLVSLDRDLEAADIDKTGVHVDALRRTFATRLIEAGADPKTVQTLLGHSTLDLTLKLYTDAKSMDLKGALDKLGGFEVKEVVGVQGGGVRLIGLSVDRVLPRRTSGGVGCEHRPAAV
jgi:integrase